MKATAQAPSNIAFIKYWGKADEALRTPLNDSFSMNLSDTYTVTTVEFSPELTEDSVTLLDGSFSDKEISRVVKGLNRIRNRANSNLFARVVTKNTFPKGAGAAASASGFAALTVASFAALGVAMTEKELSIFARLGSGSACRSIPDGFVLWQKGSTPEESFAYSLYPHDYWDLCDCLLIVDTGMKKVSTTEGMELVRTSPFLEHRLSEVPNTVQDMIAAFEKKDFLRLGALIEKDCLSMHHVMQTQDPPLMYWNSVTQVIMETVRSWRSSGLHVFFTIDAGPNVHLICESKNQDEVVKRSKEITGVQTVLLNHASEGAHTIDTHLF